MLQYHRTSKIPQENKNKSTSSAHILTVIHNIHTYANICIQVMQHDDIYITSYVIYECHQK